MMRNNINRLCNSEKGMHLLWRAQKVSIATVGTVFKAFFLTGFSFVILYPIILMVARTFMGKSDVYDNTVLLIPKAFTLVNIQAAIMQLDYWPVLSNTVFLALSSTLLTLLSCLMAGYALARFDFKLKGIIFVLIIITIIVPPQVLSVPMFFNFRFFDVFGFIKQSTGQSINLTDTFFPFWFLSITGMGIKNGLFIYLFRQFFRNIPKELEEAAEIDGASSFKTFIKVMIPNAATIITTVSLFSLIWQYNDSIYSNLFLSSKKVFATCYTRLERFNDATLQFLGFTANDNGITVSMYLPIIRSAGVLLMMAPLILVFLFSQKYFVESVERSGIVG